MWTDGRTLSLGFNLIDRPADLASLQRKLDAGRRKNFVRQTELHRPPAYSFAFRQNCRIARHRRDEKVFPSARPRVVLPCGKTVEGAGAGR